MTFTDWAAANVVLAALLFAWIVADSLLLATIAKAKDRKPGLRAMLGAGAAASVIVLVGAAAPVREAWQSGHGTIEINPQPTDISRFCHAIMRAPAARVLERLSERIG